MAKSYYAILGLTSLATADEIRSAYRRLAKAYHPDRYPGNSHLFRQVQEAYAALGNAERRRQYERQIRRPSMPRPVPARPGPGPEPLIPKENRQPLRSITPLRPADRFGPSRDHLFDWAWSNFSSLLPSRSGRVRSLHLEIPVDGDQMRRGGTTTIMVPVDARCPQCLGTGGVGPYECHRCAGEGAITGEIPVAVAFPPGHAARSRLSIPLTRYGIHDLLLTVDLVVDDTAG